MVEKALKDIQSEIDRLNKVIKEKDEVIKENGDSDGAATIFLILFTVETALVGLYILWRIFT